MATVAGSIGFAAKTVALPRRRFIYPAARSAAAIGG